MVPGAAMFAPIPCTPRVAIQQLISLSPLSTRLMASSPRGACARGGVKVVRVGVSSGNTSTSARPRSAPDRGEFGRRRSKFVSQKRLGPIPSTIVFTFESGLYAFNGYVKPLV